MFSRNRKGGDKREGRGTEEMELELPVPMPVPVACEREPPHDREDEQENEGDVATTSSSSQHPHNNDQQQQHEEEGEGQVQGQGADEENQVGGSNSNSNANGKGHDGNTKHNGREGGAASGKDTLSSSSSGGREGRKEEREKPVRRYVGWPGNEKFFCGGHCVTGPFYWGIVGTAVLILIPCTVFVALVAFPLYSELENGVVLLVFSFALVALAMSSLFCSGCMDPGIIPRSPPPANQGHIPRTRNVEVNGHMVVVRYNETCNFYQPPRAHHCSVLNDCIERFDHYCPWVGTTIGKRNYRFYLIFVFSSSILSIFTFACSAYLVKLRADEAETSVIEAMRKEPAAMFVMAYVFIGFWFVGGLSFFHIYLLSKNQTTYENIRYSYDR